MASKFDKYKSLNFTALNYGATYFRPTQDLPERVTLDNPAVDVMTDLRQVTAYTAELTTPLNKALENMVKRGVRMLLVRDADGAVLGLITSRDIQGEKPLKILEKTGGKRDELLVRDIMTLQGKLDVLQMDDVLNATVGDIVVTLRDAGRQHALVVDEEPHLEQLAVRGIFSLSQIGNQLGLNIERSERATTFSELEQALTSADKR